MPRLLIFLLLKTLLIAIWMATSGVELAPDEAQYWTWSQALDFGYYSKPPGIAWAIAAGTALLGDTPFGVRAFALLVGILAPILIYFLTLTFASKRAALWAGILTALTPLGVLSSIYATTDGPYCIFWTLSLMEIFSALEKRSVPNYWRLGLWIAIGALFKWPIYLFWIVVLGTAFYCPRMRSPKIAGGIALSLAGLLPPLWWNIERGFPTFRHVLSTMAGGHAPKEALIFNGNFWGFFGAQAALLSPLFFALLLWALWVSFSSFNKIPRSARLAAVLTVAILGIYQAVSLFMKIQGNWAVFAYPGAIALLGWFLSDVKKSRLLFSLGALVALLESLFILLLPYQQTDPEALVKLPFKLNRFRECMGWDALGPLLTAEGYLPGHDFLIADSYQNASLLSFYAPQQKRAFFFNIRGRRQNQFSYWPQLREENRGKSGYFVTTEELPKSAEELALQKKETLDGLAKHFKLVLFLKSEPLYCTYGEPAKLLMIFRVEDYQGTEPEETFLY